MAHRFSLTLFKQRGQKYQPPSGVCVMSSANNYKPAHGLSLRNSRFIAYLRPDAHRPLSQQRSEISRFCSDHGYNIVKEYVDTEVAPGPVLQEALDHMQLV